MVVQRRATARPGSVNAPEACASRVQRLLLCPCLTWRWSNIFALDFGITKPAVTRRLALRALLILRIRQYDRDVSDGCQVSTAGVAFLARPVRSVGRRRVAKSSRSAHYTIDRKEGRYCSLQRYAMFVSLASRFVHVGHRRVGWTKYHTQPL